MIIIYYSYYYYCCRYCYLTYNNISSYYCYKSHGRNCSCCTWRSGPFLGTCRRCLLPAKPVKGCRRTIPSSTMKSKRYRKYWRDSDSFLRTVVSVAAWKLSFCSLLVRTLLITVLFSTPSKSDLTLIVFISCLLRAYIIDTFSAE